MKRFLFIIACITCDFISMAQTVVNPVFDRTDNYVFHINSVELADDTTYVYCSLYVPDDSWANISPNTFLEETSSNRRYTIIRSEGIPFAPMERNFDKAMKCEVKLIFPKIQNALRINLVENPNGEGFNVWGVSLKDSIGNKYTDSDYNHNASMTKFWVSAGDSVKAIGYKTKEVEAAKYLFGERSNLYISELNQLADLFSEYKNHPQSMIYREKMAHICWEICNRLVKTDTQPGAISYYLQDIDFFYANQVKAFRFFYDNKEWNKAKCHIQNVYQILQGRENISLYIPIVLYYLGISSYYAKNEEDAEKYYQMSYDSFQKYDEARQYPLYGELLNGMSILYYMRGDYNKAYQYAQESCGTFAVILGKDSKEYAFALAGLSNAEMMLNMKQEGVSHAELASAIIEKASDVPNELKEVYRERLYVIKNALNESLTTSEDKNGSPAGNIVMALFEANNDALSGNLNSAIQKFYKIRDYQEEHFEIIDLQNYIRVIVTLADALTQTGRLTEADNVLDNAISTLQKYQVTTNQVRHIYCSKGMLYYMLNDNLSAIRWYKKAIDLFHQVKDNSISYARLLSNISMINMQIGNYEEANEQLEEAYDISSKFYAENVNNSNDIFLILNNLANNYVKMDNTDRAIEIYTSIITDATSCRNMRAKVLAMNNLAEFYITKEKFEKAINLLLEVTAMDVDGYIKEMAEYNLLFCLLMKKDINAVERLSTFNQSMRRQVSEVFGRFSESERERYWMQKAGLMVLLNNLAVLTFDSPETRRMAYDNALYTKSMLLNSGRLLDSVIKRSDETVKESYEMMRVLNEKLSNKGNSKDSIDNYLQRINNIEKQIIASIPDFDERLTSQFKSYKDVKNQLSDNDIAIEFIFLPHIKLAIEETEFLYGALIQTKKDDAPKMVSLCRDKELGDLISHSQNSTNDLYSIQNKKLYELVWQKIDPYIPTGANIYFSPTGDICKINLSAISDGALRLMDKFNLYEVSSTALIYNAKLPTVSQIHSAAIYGDIDYYTDPKTMTKISNTYKSYTSEPLMANRSIVRNTWDLLPGTKKEITAINDILAGKGIQVHLLSQSAANEESFKALNACAPDIIHIATHGFYFPNKVGTKSNFFSDLKSYTYNDSHLLYCGLLFSGANNAWTGGSIATDVEDGILTANEISHLDLSNASLAVLSACETGLGDISKVDGVYGLQRGLKRAGVGTILMSLWKVDDEATKILMVEFYRNLMSGKTKYLSLKEAQQYLRQVENGKYDNPKYWASFILLDGLN